MACITEMPSPTFPPIWIFDVSYSIGWGRSNRRDDVALVQYALNRIIAKAGVLDITARATPGPVVPIYPQLPPLAVDGIFGPKTWKTIYCYQSQSILGSTPVAADGVVDPLHRYLAGLTGDPVSPRNIVIKNRCTRYTIYKLNRDHLKLYGRMMDDVDMPAVVRAAIARPPTAALA